MYLKIERGGDYLYWDQKEEQMYKIDTFLYIMFYLLVI